MSTKYRKEVLNRMRALIAQGMPYVEIEQTLRQTFPELSNVGAKKLRSLCSYYGIRMNMRKYAPKRRRSRAHAHTPQLFPVVKKEIALKAVDRPVEPASCAKDTEVIPRCVRLLSEALGELSALL